MIDGHGDDIHRFGGNIKYNFSSNIYYKGCPPELLVEISSHTNAIQSYPSPAAHELNEAAAARFNLLSDQLLFTNGATEAFYLIAQAFSGKRAAIVAPTFSEYQDACKIHGLNYDLLDKQTLTPRDYDLVFICNPNNPDGSIFKTDELRILIAQAPSTIFIIDEAYIEFTNQIESIVPSIAHLSNLIVVRSLTKTFSIPGIRLGYVIASSAIISPLRSKKMPWSVNALAIHAGLQIFTHYEHWLFNVDDLLKETEAFVQQLSAVDWLEVIPSHTSYFLVKLKKGNAAELKNYLAVEHRMLIRDATNFKKLEGQHIRLSTQSEKAQNALLEALKQWK